MRERRPSFARSIHFCVFFTYRVYVTAWLARWAGEDSQRFLWGVNRQMVDGRGGAVGHGYPNRQILPLLICLVLPPPVRPPAK